MLKKKLVQWMAVLTAVGCLCGCAETVEPGREIPGAPLQTEEEFTYEQMEVKEAPINTSTLLATNIDLVDRVSAGNPGQNVMISGTSLNYALAMLGNGAEPEARQAIEAFLGQDIASVNAYYGSLLNRPETGSGNKLVIKNAFWVDETLDYDVKKDYLKVLEDVYQAHVQEIPMDAKGIKKVNRWAAKATDNMVQNALSPQDITEDTVSIIMNTTLLDGKWDKPFRKENTRDVDFTMASGDMVKVRGMHDSAYMYYENEYATGFRKDYKQKEYYMIAVLPKEEGDFTLAGLDLEGLVASGKTTLELNAELSIMLPKTDFEVKYNLTQILKAAGLEQLFDKNRNNFPEMYDNDSPDFKSYASAVIQNDRLIIDEESTRAAAVTSIMVDNCTTAWVEKLQLRVYLDRPYVLLLMDGETDEPLFVAKIMKP